MNVPQLPYINISSNQSEPSLRVLILTNEFLLKREPAKYACRTGVAKLIYNLPCLITNLLFSQLQNNNIKESFMRSDFQETFSLSPPLKKKKKRKRKIPHSLSLCLSPIFMSAPLFHGIKILKGSCDPIFQNSTSFSLYCMFHHPLHTRARTNKHFSPVCCSFSASIKLIVRR